jgi:hypothetical protein
MLKKTRQRLYFLLNFLDHKKMRIKTFLKKLRLTMIVIVVLATAFTILQYFSIQYMKQKNIQKEHRHKLPENKFVIFSGNTKEFLYDLF